MLRADRSLRHCHKYPSLCLCLVAALLAAAPTPGAAARWDEVTAPSRGGAEVIGGYANGCISGARALTPEGPGYQAIRLSRRRAFGHPDLIAFIRRFGRSLAAAGLGDALIGDLAQPRGGPMPSGHKSHQTGLDVDIWFRRSPTVLTRAARERVTAVAVADAARLVLTDQWRPVHARMLQLAAADPRVVRIFVNPAIKRTVCRGRWSDRRWIAKLRPWHGHNAHFHVRLGCPADSPRCRAQSPVPRGDGCGAELASWFRPPDADTRPRPRRRPVLPAACAAVLTAAGQPHR